ncbi:hypothetical protein VYA_32330 [Vibrio alfacsensis]|nr:hypothetical protein VA249_32930 [Vibrio alfacsensis]BCN26041.1 hypothetical protein VYA_32330 [Vibrio alfacsensis]
MKQVRKLFSFCTSTLIKAVSHYSAHQSLNDHGYSITPIEQVDAHLPVTQSLIKNDDALSDEQRYSVCEEK